MEAHALVTEKDIKTVKSLLVWLPIFTVIFSAGIAWGIISVKGANTAETEKKDYDYVMSEVRRLQMEKLDITRFEELRDDIKYIRTRIDEHINQSLMPIKKVTP